MFFHGKYSVRGDVYQSISSTEREQLLLTTISTTCKKRIEKINAKVITLDAVTVNKSLNASVCVNQVVGSVFATDDVGVILALSPVAIQMKKQQMLDQGHMGFIAAKVIESYIVHEEAHIEQLRSGRLLELPDGGIRWENKQYTQADIKTIGYDNLPWEVEAEKSRRAFMAAL